jgi:MoaA/NifB/PqqE/SkfB family radical SAM enzyme
LIRKIYSDFIRDRFSKGDIKWIFGVGLRYALIRASFLIGRPLCGPILGTLITNYRCNYHCEMCNLPLRDNLLKEKGLKELSTVQLKQLLKDFSDLGTAGIGFTGGEPLIREDIFELLKYAKSLNMITHLNSNGFFLTKEAAKKLIDTKIDSINISLDGARPETHDKIRGFPGAFDKAISAIGLINAAREKIDTPPRLKIVTVMSRENIDEIPELARLSEALKTDCIEFIPRQPFSPDSGFSAPLHDSSFLKKLEQTTAYLLKLKQSKIKIENSCAHIRLFRKSFENIKSPLTCYAGYNSCAVDCYGEIYPCMPWINWNKPAANINDIPLKKFWYSNRYNRIRKDIARCRDCYLNCQTELNILFNN